MSVHKFGVNDIRNKHLISDVATPHGATIPKHGSSVIGSAPVCKAEYKAR
jgi:hypothetical protein